MRQARNHRYEQLAQMIDMTYLSLRTFFSQLLPTPTSERILLYFPQAHSKSFTGLKIIGRRPSRSGLCSVVDSFRFNTSPLILSR
jgi:hypothetical protein